MVVFVIYYTPGGTRMVIDLYKLAVGAQQEYIMAILPVGGRECYQLVKP